MEVSSAHLGNGLNVHQDLLTSRAKRASVGVLPYTAASMRQLHLQILGKLWTGTPHSQLSYLQKDSTFKARCLTPSEKGFFDTLSKFLNRAYGQQESICQFLTDCQTFCLAVPDCAACAAAYLIIIDQILEGGHIPGGAGGEGGPLPPEPLQLLLHHLHDAQTRLRSFIYSLTQ